MTRAKIYIVPKKDVLDPQGKVVKKALTSLGFSGIKDLRIGKYIDVVMDQNPGQKLNDKVKSMCEKLLANEVIEDYFFEIEGE